MNRLPLLFSVFLSFTLALPGQQAPSPAWPAGDLSAEEWAEDLTYLREQLLALHPNPFFRITRDSFDRRFDRYLTRLPDASPAGRFALLLRMVAAIEDGHTNIRMFGNAFAVRLLPVDPFLFAEGVFLKHAVDTTLTGAEVLAINGHPVGEVLERLLPLVAADNVHHARNGLGRWIVMPELLHAAGLLRDPTAAIPLTLRKNGEERTVPLAPLTVREYFTWRRGIAPAAAPVSRSRNVYVHEPPSLYWRTFLPGERAIYFQYNQLINRPDWPMRAFSDSLARDLRHARKLIIDLREAPGGNKGTMGPLVRAIKASPVNAPGRLFVLTGRRTNSAATSFITRLRAETHAVTVGEPIGGSPLFYSDVTRVTLPNSGIRVEISTRFNLDSYFRDDRRTHAPDHFVPERAADWFAGRDAALAFALGYAPAVMPPTDSLPATLTGRYLLDSGQLLELSNQGGTPYLRVPRLLDLPLRKAGDGSYRPQNSYPLRLISASDGEHLEVDLQGVRAQARKLAEGALAPLELIEAGQIAEGLLLLEAVRERYPGRHVLGEADLNRIGYRLLRRGEVEKAIAVFRTNVDLWPASSNVYDSLGEAYLVAEEWALALEHYRKSVRINPQNEGGKKAIERLEQRE